MAIQNRMTMSKLQANPSQIVPRATRKPYTSVRTSLMRYATGKQMTDTETTTSLLPKNSKGSWKSTRSLLAMMLLTSSTVTAMAMMMTSLPEKRISASTVRRDFAKGYITTALRSSMPRRFWLSCGDARVASVRMTDATFLQVRTCVNGGTKRYVQPAAVWERSMSIERGNSRDIVLTAWRAVATL